MKKFIPLLVALALLATPALAFAGGGGFDANGYNYQARIFVGTGASWCLAGGGLADCGLGIYAPDKLVMKWNAAWDACNATATNDDPTVCAGAWTDNEWNGNVPGGSDAVWHYKIIWVGSAAENSAYWLPGGYSVWGNYEVIMDQGLDPNLYPGQGHFWGAHAIPNGYGVQP
jgi:hypothetical protein